jgi:DNA modification methylase
LRRYGKAGPRHSRRQRIAEEEPEYKTEQNSLLAQRFLPLNFSSNGSKNGSAFKDPAFGENKILPVHRWVPWIAGFSASFVDSVCAAYLRPNSKRSRRLVLDPFAGVGTTLLQAVLNGHDAVGFEINPYPALAATAKLQTLKVNLEQFDAWIDEARRSGKAWHSTPPPKGIMAPDMRTRIPFLSPRVERQVLHALSFFASIPDERIATLFRIALGSIIVSVSNYTYEPSLGSRPGAGKPLVEDADVLAVLLHKLHQMRADIAWLREQAKETGTVGSGRAINANFLTANDELETASVDLMITSPPYMNNYHYVRNTRPQLYWLSFISSPQQQRELETGNFGKFWQTVRDGQDLALNFQHRHLEGILKQLRETRKSAGAYGGPGWANYVTAYFNDSYQFLAVLKRVLRRKGVGVIVIGNSIIQGMEVKVEQILGELAIQQGFELEGIPCIRDKRVGASITQSSVRRGFRTNATLYESAVIIRKP